jgi:hypothetical protein
MKRTKAVKKEDLINFCKRQNIFVPKSVTMKYLYCAISRMYLHGHDDRVKNSCFGYWEQDEANCLTCDYETDCFAQSMGMDKDAYLAQLKKLEGDKFESAKSFRTKNKK